MSAHQIQLDAGGLLLAATKVDPEATEQVVARSYLHPALGARPVVRLASDRLGPAEDLAMEFLGFQKPAVSPPIAVQQRRSLSFAAWALTNDAKNAHYALDLVKQMKAAARVARAKPGHAWDTFNAMAKELGRSVRHFLPPFWEEVGRTFKDLGNQTYAGRALNSSLEAERVHALASDRARRRDVILEFVLAGCLGGKALSDYASDLQKQYPADEAFAIFRDLCVRRTSGGMAPWTALPNDFQKLAKAAKLNVDRELEAWLEEMIDAPAMGRAALQFWKACSACCKRIVARNPAFAIALLRHTHPTHSYGTNKVWAWLDLLESWGVLEFLPEDGLRGAPPLGEPIAKWLGRLLWLESIAPARVLNFLEQLAPRLRQEGTPLPVVDESLVGYHRNDDVDVDVMELCLTLGIRLAELPADVMFVFDGWLAAQPDHPRRNQDLVHLSQETRLHDRLLKCLRFALACRGGTYDAPYGGQNFEQRTFPLAAAERPAITKLWRQVVADQVEQFETSALSNFEDAVGDLRKTLWPDTFRLFPDLGERLLAVQGAEMLRRSLQAGIVDEYGYPALEKLIDQRQIKIKVEHWGEETNLWLTYPCIAITDRVHAWVLHEDGSVREHELRLPKKASLQRLLVVGQDLAVYYRDESYGPQYFHWTSDPTKQHKAEYTRGGEQQACATPLPDGGVFLGLQACHGGDATMPDWGEYLHDGQRFWRVVSEYKNGEHEQKVHEVDPQTGKQLRQSVPPWFEQDDGGKVNFGLSNLMKAPAGVDSPLGTKDGLVGWKVIARRDGGSRGVGIDGRAWDQPLRLLNGLDTKPIGLLAQPGGDGCLPVSTQESGRQSTYWIWDPTGATVVSVVTDFESGYAAGQAVMLPFHFWHFWQPRHVESSRQLRQVDAARCKTLLAAASKDRASISGKRDRSADKDGPVLAKLTALLPAVREWLPKAPERMVLGIARFAEHAERVAADFEQLVSTVAQEAKQPSTAATKINHRALDLAAEHWLPTKISLYGEDREKASVSATLLKAAAFLKGEAPEGDLPQTGRVWYPMLDHLSLRCWQTYWVAAAAKLGQKEGGDVAWLDFLDFWCDLGLDELPGEFAVMTGRPASAKKKAFGFDIDTNDGHSYTLLNGADRFVVIEGHSYSQSPLMFLRYSTAKTPGLPPGYVVENLALFSGKAKIAELREFVAAARARTTLALPTPEELQASAERLGVSPAEVALVWLGGLNIDSYENNFLPTAIRTALGLKLADANAARQALRNLNDRVRLELYEAVVGLGPAACLSDDRGPVFRHLESVWHAKMPRRFAIDASLQKRLSAMSKEWRWQQVDNEAVLAIAAEPTSHPLMQPRDMEVRLKPTQWGERLEVGFAASDDEPITASLLRSLTQLVALVHGETPAGHPARSSLAPLIQQVDKLLADRRVLLEFLSFNLYGETTNANLAGEWINKNLGPTTLTKEKKAVFTGDGIEAVGYEANSMILLAVRPALLQGRTGRDRLIGLLSSKALEAHRAPAVLSIIELLRSPGFQKLTSAITPPNVADGQWPHDPRLSAPAVVAAIEQKLKVSQEAATLYAQLLALPEPTNANVQRWNGWTPAKRKAAETELAATSHVLQAKRDRAGRELFLPGEWIELKAPWLPIESWKLTHLYEMTLPDANTSPAGGPLVLRPFDELFQAVWQRVIDGEGPRYEEAQRKPAKGKKR